MDTTAKKTLRGMSFAFGTLADTLHLPDSIRCCGVGAIEAQIAAGNDDDDGSTSDDSVFAISKIGGQDSRANSSRSNAQKSPKARKKNKKDEKRSAEGKSVGGLRGMLSSAGSLGWGKRKGGGAEDDQSRISRVSGLSFLSGGVKKLASTSESFFQSLRAPSSFLLDEHNSDGSDLTSMSETESSDGGEPPRGVVLWRHVRMVVRGVRGMRGVFGENSRLERTVNFRAARRIQGVFRRRRACKVAAGRRSAALAALKRAEEARRQRRCREADARKRYKEACRAEGKRVLDWAVKVFLQPRAVVDLQRVWRGYRARKRLAAYLKWLEDKARRRREYLRYLEALAAARGAGGLYNEQVKRRVWGRVEFAHTGWRPRYEVENPPNMHDHVWNPPRGSSSGVRTHKVLLPPPSERDRVTLVEDKNAWAGVPVGIAKRKPPPERLGPPCRPGTIAGAGCNGRGLPPSAVGGDGSGGLLTKYNWIPAPLVGNTPLLQTPSTIGSL